MAFLFEEWNEPYLQYGEVNTAEEKAILCPEPCQSFWLCQKAGQGGVEVATYGGFF